MARRKFEREFNMPPKIPQTLEDKRAYFGAGGDPTLSHPEWEQKENQKGESELAKRHAKLRKMFLWPVAASIAAVSIMNASFDIDPLGDDFLIHGWEHYEHFHEDMFLEAPESLELYAGEERELGAWVNRSAVSMIYECTDESVAIIDDEGMVTGKKPGTAIIKVNCPDVSLYAEVAITVTEAPYIELGDTSVTLSPGESVQISARAVGFRESDFPDGEPAILFESDNWGTVSVSQDGTVTAKDFGYSVIRVRCPSLGLESSVTVTVSADGLHLSADSLKLYTNESKPLGAELYDGNDNRINKTLTYEVDRPAALSVESDGTVISGEDSGEFIVTVRCDNPSFESAVTITVISPAIDLNEKSSASLGDEWDLTPYIVETVDENESPSFTYQSDNPELISVSEDGHVTVLTDGGSATITVTCDYPPATREITVTVEQHEHVYGDWITLSAATCTVSGSHEHVCEICGETEIEEIPAAGHTEVEDRAVAATCTASGKTAGSHCSVCGEVLTAQRTVAALGHDYQTEGATCSRCGNSLVTIQIVTHSDFDASDTGVTTTLSPTGRGSTSSNPIEVVVEMPFELKHSFNVSGVDQNAVMWTCEPQTIDGDTYDMIYADMDNSEGICYCGGMMQTENNPPTRMYMTFRYNGKLYTVSKYFRIIDN